MNRKTKFKIMWAIYCILVSPLGLLAVISYLFDSFIRFCVDYVENVKNWILTKYKQSDEE